MENNKKRKLNKVEIIQPTITITIQMKMSESVRSELHELKKKYPNSKIIYEMVD